MKAKYITPCVTALNEDNTLDLKAQGEMYDHLIKGGIDGILILGSIGEFFALTMEQKKELITFATSHINKRVPLIVGTTSLVYDEIIELSNFAFSKNADSVMVIPPFYFWFTEEDVERYFSKIAENINGNMYLYNFPDRVGYDLTPNITLNLLRKHKNIIGLKDTLSGVDHTREVIKTVKGEFPDFEVYSGFDDNFAHNVLAGGDGCIGGLSNIYPELFSDWVKAFNNNDLEKVAEIQQEVDKLMDIYGVGKPFVPYIKKALKNIGMSIKYHATFPMPLVTKEQEQMIEKIMSRYNNN